MDEKRTRVLAVGMFDSVHFSRWLRQFSNERIDFLLIPSSPHRKRHQFLSELLSEGHGRQATFRAAPFADAIAVPFWLVDRFMSKRLLGTYLSTMVRIFKPHFVHGLELQSAGYSVLRAARSIRKSGAEVIVTNYGSDIFWFSRYPRHRNLLTKLLAFVDRYSCECERDVGLAKALGYSGKVMEIAPNSGGFDLEDLEGVWLEPSSRNCLAIKGYQGWVGRAVLAIDALELISDQLRDMEIVFYSCNWRTIRAARRLSRRTGLTVKTFSKGSLQHREVLELFGKSKVYVGVSLSDGISTSMLEAMATGAIPVQTATACCEEWFEGTGVSIHNLTKEAVADAILQGLLLAQDVNNLLVNKETIRSRASEVRVREAALDFYR